VSTCWLHLPCGHGALPLYLAVILAIVLLLLQRRTRKTNYHYRHRPNPRNVLFCNVAQPASRATVAAVVCPNWRDTTQAVGFHHYICLSLKKEFCISVLWLLFHRRSVSALFCFVVYVITFTVFRKKKISVTSATGL
jgi:uncharacterized MAPEG superfamily protein